MITPSTLFNILTFGQWEAGKQRETHRREVMSPEESEAYDHWLSDQIISPRIGATIPCPVNLQEIDARTARPSTPRLA